MARKLKSSLRADRDGGQFLALPFVVLRSPGYRVLGYAARCLLLDLCLQLGPSNNGRLQATLAGLSPLGWRSKDTLSRCLRELQAAGLIVETRKGGINFPSWYAVTWMPLRVTAGLDINPRYFERGAYMRQPAAVNAAPTIGAVKARIAPVVGVDDATVAPTIGAVAAQNGAVSTPMVGAYLDMPSAAAAGCGAKVNR